MRLFRGKRVWLILLTAVVVAGVYGAVSGKRLDVPTMTVSRGVLHTYVEDTGKVQAIDEMTVYAPLGGRVEKVPLKVGDPVKEGQLVAQITQDQQAVAEAGLAKAQARLLEAQRSEASARKLYESGAISESEYDRARTELKMAEDDARIAATQYGTATKLGQATLVSPATGTVLEVLAKENQVLAPGGPVVVIGDLSRLEIRTELLTYDAVNVRAGQKAIISGAVLGDTRIEATVNQVYPKAVTRVSTLGLEQQRVPVIINLAEAGTLRPGFDVDVRIITGSRDGVIVVPKAAVFQKGTENCVYVVERGVVRSRAIQLGIETAEAAEVVSGLNEGEVIVPNPRGEVKEGTRVRAQ
ncbi:MAG: efflux RND transporter periplasmic adaptor subunit [Ignavibacteriales bacterium]